jgi:ribosomal protein S18 acetylase RimI-like enzyme
MVLGWMSFASSRDDDASATTGELWAIYIDPDHWRRGVGQALWEVGATRLRAAGFRDCTLWVLRDNPAAQAFYAAHGFVVDPGTEKVFELGGAAIAEIRMRATLHP